MTTTWTITQTDYLVADSFITTAHWTASAVEASLAAQIALLKNPVTAAGTP